MTRVKLKPLGDALAVLVACAAGVVCWRPSLLSPHRAEVYVSPQGSDWHDGSSPARALATVQRALDLARPGADIILLPGRYRERIRVRHSGTRDKPITLKALEAGTAVLSGAAAAEAVAALQWEPEGNGIYAAETPWAVYRMTANGRHLYRCVTEEVFREVTARPNAWDAFYASGHRVLGRLRGGESPSKAPVLMNGPVPERLANGLWRATNVWVEASHIRFDGLRFEMGVSAGVHIHDGRDIAVGNCLLNGANVGVASPACVGLVVDHCAYLGYPQGEWRRGWLSWREAYGDGNRGPGLVLSHGDDALIRGNLISHASDGMQVTTADTAIQSGAEVSGNLIAFCDDDAVEFDGFAKQINFHHNLIYDCETSLGTSPVLVGPVRVHHNLFLHPAGGLNGVQVKLLSPWLKAKAPWNGPIRNVHIFHNTFVGHALCWWSTAPVTDVHVHQNVFAVQYKKAQPWPSGVSEAQNTYVQLPPGAYPNPGRNETWFRGASPSDGGKPRGYVGATPPGRRWAMARPGPDWLDWRTHPATSRLLEAVDPRLWGDAP